MMGPGTTDLPEVMNEQLCEIIPSTLKILPPSTSTTSYNSILDSTISIDSTTTLSSSEESNLTPTNKSADDISSLSDQNG